MTRENSKSAYYFSHDCNARNDNKILALRSVYGLEGYAIYFMMIEILREQTDYKYPISKYTFNAIAIQMQSSAEKVEKVLKDCFSEFKDDNSSLLVIDENFIWSESLLRRMEKADNVRQTRSNAAKKRWENQEECKSDANALHKQSKIMQIKRKEIVNKDIYSREASEIISYLNQITGKSYRPGTQSTGKHIGARLNEGYSIDDFKRVIDSKSAEWLGDDKMQAFLRPETLFGTKFESYLNSAPQKEKNTFEEIPLPSITLEEITNAENILDVL